MPAAARDLDVPWNSERPARPSALSPTITCGLLGAGQLRSNPLGLATAVVFLSSGIGHGLHDQMLIAGSTAIRAARSWARRLSAALPGMPATIEDAVREQADRRVAAIVDAMAVGVLVMHPDGSVSDVNVAGRAILDAVGSTATAAFAEPVRKARSSEEAQVDVERSLAARDGGPPRWLRITARRLPRSGAAGASVLVTFVDVSERRAMSAALAASEERFRTTFEAAPIGMGRLSLDGQILQANDAWARIVGRTREELEGLDLQQLTHPTDAGDDALELARLAEGVTSGYRVDKCYVMPDESPVWVQLDVSLVREPDGRPAYGIAQIQDITDRRRYEEQLLHLAEHDGLTGLLNRRGFVAELERHLTLCRRYGPDGALMMIDLDHFKYVNDSLGHRAGDEFMVDVANILRAACRDSDVIGRLGGDEFAILLPRGGQTEAAALALPLLEALRKRGARVLAGPLIVSASIGIAAVRADTEADELLAQSDVAMYEAKDAGRDRFEEYDAERDRRSPTCARTTWPDRIRAALNSDDGFELVGQPIRPAGELELAPMYELLLRMRDADGQMITPATFLYIAERVDLIQEIDRMVVARAVSFLEHAPLSLSVTINMSGKSFGDPLTLQAIDREIARADIDPGRLVIEITETAAVEHMARAEDFGRALKEIGCRLAIDDFGAGFGSFYYLKHLPFDFLKLDGEFVVNAPQNRADELIVDAACALAHGLGGQVVAEFCDSELVLEFLRTRGVDFVQGYHVGRPMPIEEIAGHSRRGPAGG